MSLSTTTMTTTFELVKYSRAYTQSTNSAASQSDLEWQHFSNPVIRLTLDIRKSPAGHLESYRLRIVWSFGVGADSMEVDERDVVFEDLDLVAYSALPSLQTPLGMPLKAVYQAATVGLRYQHPRVVPPGQSPQYRRFQVAFLTESAATAFIDSIRFICPCKANTGPPARMPRPNPTQSNTMFKSQASMTTHTTTSMARPSVTLRQSGSAMTVDEHALLSHRSASVRRNKTILPVSDISIDHFEWGDGRPSGLAISQEHHHVTTQSGPSPMNDSDGSRPSSAVTTSSAIAHHSSSRPTSGSQPVHDRDRDRNHRIPDTTLSDLERPSSSQRRRKEMFAQGSSSDVDTSLPSSSLPASSPPRPLPRSPDLMPPPPVPRQASIPGSSQTMQTPPSSAPGHAASVARPSVNVDVPLASGAAASATLQSDIAATLRDAAGLYQLSNSQLESLVAETVREKGSQELMAALDGMWKIKGLAGIHM